MKKFQAVRKPIYVCKIVANASDFQFTTPIFEQFTARNPEFANCKYDSQFDCQSNTWTLLLYRECAVDFVEASGLHLQSRDESTSPYDGVGSKSKTVLRTCRKGE